MFDIHLEKKNQQLIGILLIPLRTYLFYIVSTTIVTQSLELNLKMQNCQSHTLVLKNTIL